MGLGERVGLPITITNCDFFKRFYSGADDDTCGCYTTLTQPPVRHEMLEQVGEIYV